MNARTHDQMPSGLPLHAPLVTKESEEFWSGLREGRFFLDRCLDCGTVVWYPRRACNFCLGTRLERFEASGRGTVYSYTVNYRGEGEYREHPGYVLAYVDLEEGPRVLTNIVGSDLEGLEVGAAVELVIERAEPDAVLYRFRLTGT